jgi:hypothetical protein
MKTIRFLAFLVLLLYGVSFFGAAFHIHENGIEKANCKLCLISATSFIVASVVHFTPTFESRPFLFSSDLPAIDALSLANGGRSPPSA